MIKVKILRCPACGAPITSKNGIRPNFCEYCGQGLVINDGVKRSEHIYRKIDEARIREAEVRMKEVEIKEKREAARARRDAVKDRWILLVTIIPRLIPLLIVAVMFFSCRAMLKQIDVDNTKREQEEARNEQTVKTISSQVKSVCENNGATIKDINAYGDNIDIYLVASDGSKCTIDALQESITNGIDLDDGLVVDVKIEYPENEIIRWVKIDKYGQVKVESDKTNSLSEEESRNIIDEYEGELKPVFDEYGVKLLSTKYEGDVLNLTIQSSTCEKERIDNLIKTIADLNKSHKSVSMDINIDTEEGKSLRETEISSDLSIKTKSDYTNEMSDEDVSDIIDDYLPALSKACKKHDANITEVTIRNDALYVGIATGYRQVNKIKELEESVNNVITNKKRITTTFDIIDYDSFMMSKGWTINKDGIIDIWYDFTEP